jgi:hypothetical protein
MHARSHSYPPPQPPPPQPQPQPMPMQMTMQTQPYDYQQANTQMTMGAGTDAAATSGLYTAAGPPGEWVPSSSSGAAAAVDWSGQYPMKEPDAGGGGGGPSAAPTGVQVGYEYYAHEWLKHQQAQAMQMQQQQQQQQQQATDLTAAQASSDATAAAVSAYDLQYYQAYAAALSASQGGAGVSFYPAAVASSVFDPAAAAAFLQQQIQLLQPPTPIAAHGVFPVLGVSPAPVAMGWQSGMQLASPTRFQTAAQLQKPFGSSGHGAGRTERHNNHKQAESSMHTERLTCSVLSSFLLAAFFQSRAHASDANDATSILSTKVRMRTLCALDARSMRAEDEQAVQLTLPTNSLVHWRSAFSDPLTYRTEVCRTHLATGHCDYGSAQELERITEQNSLGPRRIR